MARQNWTRQETLVAFSLYCQTPFGKLHARNPEIIETAVALGRTPSALAMKCCNLAALDSTLQLRGISGLSKTSAVDKEVWNAFEADPEAISFEAEQAYSNLMSRGLRATNEIEWEDVRGLDQLAITRVRVNQHFFRTLILTGYQCECAVCGLPFQSLLVASHIIPWAIDKSLRMKPSNGICLCSLHDRAFDRGLMLIAPDYTIDLHPRISDFSDIRAVDANFSCYLGQKLKMPDRWYPDRDLLERQYQLMQSSQPRI